MSDRNISTVIDAVLTEVPTYHMHLRQRLGVIRNSAIYTSPEAMHLRWADLAATLGEHLPNPPVEPWQVRVDEIMRGLRTAGN